jgi:hypothetical protein
VDAATDAARMLVALHERVERQFEAYEAAEGSTAARYRAVAAVARALATHVAVEDELLYPALQAHTGRHDPEIERQLAQDHLLDLVMVELGGMIPSDRGYDGKVQVLVQVFRQHARDAEALLVPELRRRSARPSGSCSAAGSWSGSASSRAGRGGAGDRHAPAPGPARPGGPGRRRRPRRLRRGGETVAAAGPPPPG